MATYGLRIGFDALPEWMTAGVGEWSEITSTTGGAQLGFYGGVGFRDDGNRVEICVAAAGGHNNGGVWDRQNRVQSIRLDVAAPAWVTREADSDATGWDGTAIPGTEYFSSDNAPVPRHLYDSIQWMPQLGCYLIGGTFAGNSAQIGLVEQRGYTPSGDSAGAWEARATYPDLPGFHHLITAIDPATGNCFGRYLYGTTAFKVSGATGAWTSFSLSGDTTTLSPGGMAYDTTRDYVVQIAGGGWFTQGAGTRCVWIDWATGVKTAITFNASSAWTDFQDNAGKFVGSALVYAADQDCFFFFNGNTGSPILSGQNAKVYKITPSANYTDAWDMSIMSVTGITPPTLGAGSGCYCKFRYVERWKTLVLIPDGDNVHYLRTA
jgi:hypothetical protein